MALPVGTDLDFLGSSRLNNVPDAVLPQQPATFAQVKQLLEGLAWKDNVKVAAQVNVTLTAPGATIDGVTMAVNDAFLAANQTSTFDNGIYVWNGAAIAATRLYTMSQTADFNSAVVTVDAGTSAGVTYRQTAVNPVVGTTPVLFVPFGTSAPPATTSTAGIAAIATQVEADAGVVTNKFMTPATAAGYAGRVKKYATDFGDGTATQFTITHNLNTRDCIGQVRRNSGAYDVILTDIEWTTVNTATVRFAGFVPSVNQFRVVIEG